MSFIEIPDALADDEDVLAATKKLLLSAISAAQEMVDEGIPTVKLSVIRGILSAAVRLASRERSVDEEMAELRGTVERMYAEMHGAIGE